MMPFLFRATLFTPVYTFCRRVVIWVFRWRAQFKNEKFDLETVIGFGDRQFFRLNRSFGEKLFRHDIPKGLGVEVLGLPFAGPVTFAAFKDDLNLVDVWLRLGVGGGCFKTVLSTPEQGNARPRIREVCYQGHDGILNALGLPGQGVSGFLRELKGCSLFDYKRPFGFSIGGFSVSEYVANATEVTSFMRDYPDHPFYIELNLSCPNLHQRKKLVITPDLLDELVRTIRQDVSAIMSIKLSPDWADTDLQAMIDILVGDSKIMLNLGNTQYKTWANLSIHPPSFTVPGGGLSGSFLFKRTLEMIDLAKPFGLPILATGGIRTADQACAVLDKGAQLIGIATGLITHPFSIPKINAAISNRSKSLS